jgi:hypothetical protein
MPRFRDASGQASIELVAVLPLVVVVVAVLWQLVLAGQALWSSAGAARAAARAHAIGLDAAAAARRAVPGNVRSGLRVRTAGDEVRVGVRIPIVLTDTRLATITSRATLPPQR